MIAAGGDIALSPDNLDTSRDYLIDRIPVGHGIWETSGIIDTAELFGKNTWIFDVQAHSPTTAPKPNTVEDGQLLMLVGPNDKNKNHEQDGDEGNDD